MTDCLVCGDPATNGLNLDAKCLDDLARDVATSARLYRELDAALVRPSRPDEGGAKRATSVGIALDDDAVQAREHIRITLVGWVRVAQEERPMARRGLGVAPTDGSGTNVAPRPAHGPANGIEWPADTVPDMARWILRNLTWYAGREWVDEMSRVFAETASEAKAAVQPDRARRVEVGPCPERLTDDEGQDAGACSGTLFAVIKPADSLLPCVIRCTTCPGEWTADRWHALGRRVRTMDPAGMRLLAAGLDGRASA